MHCRYKERIMTPLQTIFITAITSILGSGVLASVIVALFNRRRTKAETKKLDSETVSTLVAASGQIVSQFQILIDESAKKFQTEIDDLRKEILDMHVENEQLRQAYHDLKNRYDALLAWSTSLAEHLEYLGIDYERPPKELCMDLPDSIQKYKIGVEQNGHKVT